MDGDEEVEESYCDSDLELERSSSTSNVNQLPLVPTEFTSIHEAMQNFNAVFDSRYGVQHAPFFHGSLQDAITEAFDSPVEQRRPLVIYLHDDRSVAAHIFAQTVMCSVDVSNLLKCQFVLWAWDVSLADNRRNFFDWMELRNLTAVGREIKIVAPSKFPLLVVLTKERGVILPHTPFIYGQDNEAATVQKLMEGLNTYLPIRQQDVEQERERTVREQFRREQSEEYQRGLETDRARQEEQRRQEQHALAIDKQKTEQRKMEDKRAQEEADKATNRKAFFSQKRREMAAKLRAELCSEGDDLVRIRISFPNGAKMEKSFRHSDSLERLFNVVFVHPDCPDNFSLFTNYPVKQLNCAPDWYWRKFFADDLDKDYVPIGTFADAELFKPVNVVVRDNDA